MTSDTPPPIPTFRPPIVWAIFAYQILSNVGSWLMIAGLFAARRYVEETVYGFVFEIPQWFWIFGAVTSAIQLAAGVLFFFLRKLSIPLFVLGLIGSIGGMAYLLAATKYLQAIGYEQLFPVAITTFLPAGMIWYALQLNRRGLLK